MLVSLALTSLCLIIQSRDRNQQRETEKKAVDVDVSRFSPMLALLARPSPGTSTRPGPLLT